MNRFKSSLMSVLDRKIFMTIFSLICLSLAGYSGIQAQDKHSEQNFQPGIPYAISDIESINTTNGNLMFNFGFGSVRGRGTAQQGISLKYNSKLYESHVMTTLDNNGDYSPQRFIRADYEGGWKYDGDYQLRVISRNAELDQPHQPTLGAPCNKPNWASVYIWKLIIYFPDGSQHEFRPTGYSDYAPTVAGQQQTGDGYFNVSPHGKIKSLSIAQNWPTSDCPSGPWAVQVIDLPDDPNSSTIYYSTDGTFMRLEIPKGQDAFLNRWTIYMPDGSKVTNGELDAQNNVLPQRVYDENGNFVTKGQVTLPDSSTVTGYIDQMGRYVARKAISLTEDHIYKLGVDGQPVIWKIKWKYITVIRPYTTSGTSDGIGRCCYSDQIMVSQPKVIDEIETPSQLGGLKYTFNYNGHDGQVAYNQDPNNPNSSPGWGDLIDVTLPSGAKAEYDYSHQVAFGTDDLLPLLGKIKEKRLKYDTTYDGNTQQVTDTWLYAISKSGTTTITGPDGGVTTQKFTPTNIDSDLSGRVHKETSPGGTIVERIWANNKVSGCGQYGCGSMRRLNTYVKTEFTTIPDNAGNPSLTAIKDYEYDKNGNVTKITEYDWVAYSAMPLGSSGNITGIPGGATVKRITESVYYNPTEDASNSTANNANSYWNSTAKKVNSATKSTTIKQPNGIAVSYTEIVYDNADITANPTQTRSWDSTKAATLPNPDANGFRLNSSNAIITSATYDQYGNPLTAIDPNGYKTKLTYDSINGFSGLYPTQTEIAFDTSLKRTLTSVYDFHTGLITSITDVDNNLTHETEYDDLGRPKKVKAAVGTALESWTTTEYNNILRRIIVRSDLNIKGDGKKIRAEHFDQLGRVRLSRTIENAATEDPEDEADGIKVQTRYWIGNPNSYQLISNPYRAATASQATNEESMGWTRLQSVNNNRHRESEKFSGVGLPAPWGGNSNSTGKVRTDFDGNRILITDQAGRQRIIKTNGLGQHTDLWEITASDPATVPVTFPTDSNIAYGYHTSYQNDTLNNLKQVNQGNQIRTYSYSSLSRLLTVTNPESGTTSYQYDNNGNAVQNVNGRGVITTNVYDALNRITQTNYSGETGYTTQNVNYIYGNVTNAIGQLTKVTNGFSTTEYLEFDRLGRVTKSQQTTDGKTYNPIEYIYNLSGVLIEEKYPSGRVVKNVLDSEGNLRNVQSKKNSDAGYWNYAKNFTYTSVGEVSSMQLGNGKWESINFNSRLQPVQIALGTTQNATNLLKLEYTFNTPNNSDNNGNVKTQTITVPAIGSDPVFTAIQNYSYDSLNRLKEAKELIGTTETWKQTFTYDRYGNRNFDELNTTTLPKDCNNNTEVCTNDRKILNPSISANNNQIDQDQDNDQEDDYLFDLTGNTIKDANGRTFIYDAENRQVEAKNLQGQTIGQYYFDGNGKRVKKYVPATGEITIFVYDLSGRMVAEYSTQLSQTPQVSYLTRDYLGSPRIITDESGNVTARLDFRPFGEMIPRMGYGIDGIRQKFTGYERDKETDLDFAQARYYQNTLGRFTTTDPLGGSLGNSQSLNKYLYVMNNPLNYIDPMGLECNEADRSGDSDACIWVTDGNGLYSSMWNSQFKEGNDLFDQGYTIVDNPSAVEPFRLDSLGNSENSRDAEDSDYQNLQGELVVLGANGRFELYDDEIIDISSSDTIDDSLNFSDSLLYGGLNPFYHPLPWKNPRTPFRPPGPGFQPTSPGSRPVVRLPPIPGPISTTPTVQAPGSPFNAPAIFPPDTPGNANLPKNVTMKVRVTFILTQLARILHQFGGALSGAFCFTCNPAVMEHIKSINNIGAPLESRIEPKPKGKREDYFSERFVKRKREDYFNE